MHVRIFTFPLLVVFLLGVLIACGGGQGPAEDPIEEDPFKVSSISTEIAAHGEAVTIDGAGLENAKVFIGVLEIVPNSKTDTKINFVVPGIAPNGPQALSIRAGENASDHPLFIGVDFPSGTLEDLEALQLPPGTAVRLAAHTYTSSDTVQLNNLSLYGTDPTKTILDLVLQSDVPDAMFTMKVDPDAELVIKDLAVQLGAFAVSGSGYPAVMLALENTPDDSTGFIGEMQLNQLAETLNTGSGSLTFDNVLITDNNVAETTLFSLMGTDATPVHVNILNSEITGEMSIIALLASGLTIEDSIINSGMLIAGGIHEPLRVKNSSLEAAHPTGSQILLLTIRGLQFEAVQVVASEGIMIGNPIGMTLPIISATTVRDSSFTVLAPPGGLSPDPVFGMEFAMQNALFDDVDFNIAGTGEIHFGTMSQAMFNNSRFVMGDDTFPDDEALLDFILEEAFDSSMTVIGSSITFESTGDVGLFARHTDEGNQSIEFIGNTVTGLAGKPNAALYVGLEEIDSELAVTVRDNVFTAFDYALDINYTNWGTGFVTGEIQDNDFDFNISNVGDVARLFDVADTIAYFDASQNIWGSHTDTATVEGLISFNGLSDLTAFNVDPITPAP